MDPLKQLYRSSLLTVLAVDLVSSYFLINSAVRQDGMAALAGLALFPYMAMVIVIHVSAATVSYWILKRRPSTSPFYFSAIAATLVELGLIAQLAVGGHLDILETRLMILPLIFASGIVTLYLAGHSPDSLYRTRRTVLTVTLLTLFFLTEGITNIPVGHRITSTLLPSRFQGEHINTTMLLQVPPLSGCTSSDPGSFYAQNRDITFTCVHQSRPVNGSLSIYSPMKQNPSIYSCVIPYFITSKKLKSATLAGGQQTWTYGDTYTVEDISYFWQADNSCYMLTITAPNPYYTGGMETSLREAKQIADALSLVQ